MDATSIVTVGAALSGLALFAGVVLWVDNNYRETLRRQRAEAAQDLRAGPLRTPAAQLLHLMKDAGWNPTAVASEEPAQFAEMLRMCGDCGKFDQCGRDLLRHPMANKWMEYCPNAQAIERLRMKLQD